MSVSSTFGDPEAALTLADRYDDAGPLEWYGAAVYPMYSEPLGQDPVRITLVLRSAAPPPPLLGLGLGLSVLGGHVALDGRRLRGVDVWTDALAAGITLELCGAGPHPVFTLTPVWMAADGRVESWTGNYGVLIETGSAGVRLHCSAGVGAPDFGELVVDVDVRDAPTDRTRYRTTLYELAVATHGRGDVELACLLWSQAAGFGHAGAAYDLGVVRYRRGELSEAEKWWRAAADHGDVRAMAGLAEILRRRGNVAEARIWRARADPVWLS